MKLFRSHHKRVLPVGAHALKSNQAPCVNVKFFASEISGGFHQPKIQLVKPTTKVVKYLKSQSCNIGFFEGCSKILEKG